MVAWVNRVATVDPSEKHIRRKNKPRAQGFPVLSMTGEPCNICSIKYQTELRLSACAKTRRRVEKRNCNNIISCWAAKMRAAHGFGYAIRRGDDWVSVTRSLLVCLNPANRNRLDRLGFSETCGRRRWCQNPGWLTVI